MLCKSYTSHSLGRETARNIVDLLADDAELRTNAYWQHFVERTQNDDVHWDRVKSIEAIGQHEVFDLSVAGTAVFMANNGMVISGATIESQSASPGTVVEQVAYIPADFPAQAACQMAVGGASVSG